MTAFGYIYKTQNRLNHKIYIGQKRGAVNLAYSGSGVLVNKAIKKYGKRNFMTSPIGYAIDQKNLNELERYLIKRYRTELGKQKVYNLSDGGEGGIGMKGKYHTEAWKLANSKRMSGKNHPLYGQHHSKRTLLKISKGVKLAYQDPVVRRRILGASNPFYGKTHTPQVCKNQSMRTEELWKDPEYRKHQVEVRTGKKHCGETKVKMSKARRLYWERLKNANNY